MNEFRHFITGNDSFNSLLSIFNCAFEATRLSHEATNYFLEIRFRDEFIRVPG